MPLTTPGGLGGRQKFSVHLTRTEVLQISHVVSQYMTSAFKKNGLVLHLPF